MRVKVLVLTIIYILCIFACPLTAKAEVSADEIFAIARSIELFEKNQNGISSTESVFSGKILENAGFDVSDWLAIGVSRFGFDEDYQAYKQAWEKNLGEYLNSTPADHLKPTELHRGVLTSLALGEDPTLFPDHDLVAQGVCDNEYLGKEGINSYIWALIALDSYDWLTPDSARNDRFAIMRETAMEQQSDGGFALTMSMPSDPDITAMVLQAFAPYKDHEIISANVEKAVGFLETAFENGECTTCETLAQMIIAYCTLGEDYTSREIYGKMVEDFLSYQRDDGGFAHLEDDKDSSEMASVQALLALSAMARQKKNCRTLYDFQHEPKSAEENRAPEYQGRNISGKGEIFILETMRPYDPDKSMVTTKGKMAAMLPGLISAGAGALAALSFTLYHKLKKTPHS